MSNLITQDERYCIISSTGGPLTICVTANNGLRARVTFSLWVKNIHDKWEKRGELKITSGDTGNGCKALEFPADTLERNALTWRIKTCSFIPSVDTGSIEVQILQDNVNSQTTKPMQWFLSSIGQCSDDAGKKIESSLYFLFK